MTHSTSTSSSGASRILRMGTRRSLLAVAQSNWVAREIERLNPGVAVEMVGIDTRGDKILDVPLTSVQGKEFFVAELDDALRSGRVDFTVHSMKDLSLERPAEFILGAVPFRENPRDVVLFSSRTLERIRRGEVIRIGTSSPRRLENLPAFLARALPSIGGRRAMLEFVEIRGNVNTRLSRVHAPDGSDRQLEAVVLALAGVNRLMRGDAATRAELERLLEHTLPMVLPVQQSPSAAAQGALAVECRRDDARTREALSRLHDEASAGTARAERAVLEEWGGGCHQRFGATCIHHPELGDVLYVRGKRPGSDVSVFEVRWQRPAPAAGTVKAWDGSRRRLKAQERRDISLPKIAAGDAVYVAHHRALPSDVTALAGARLWVAGVMSWEKLAERGFWVEGCAEGLGEWFLVDTLRAPALRLPEPSRFWVLTHDGETGGDVWNPERRIATYSVDGGADVGAIDGDARAALAAATHVYWSSGSQARVLSGLASRHAVHACGPGKTAVLLREMGLKPVVFPGAEVWREWVGLEASE